jgi:two-component system response regulator DesR
VNGVGPAVGPGAPIRILLAEDQAMVRGALATLLSLEPDLEVVAEVERGDRVEAAVRTSDPDVAILDIEMPGMRGIEAARRLREVGFLGRIVIVTTFDRPGYLRAAMEAGADGFLLKDAPARELVVAIRKVVAGEHVVDPAFAAEALREGDSPLTPRETEVLAESRFHGTIAEMASRLRLSEGTVRNHLSSAIKKLGARNRAEALEIATSKGWL